MNQYTKTDWTNDQSPAINAANLNKIEAQLELLTNTLIAQETKIVTQTLVATQEITDTDTSSS